MDIDQMPAGREMDALIAERVMGWTQIHRMDLGDFCGVPPQGAPPYVLPHYSTNLDGAWLVAAQIPAAFFLEHPFTVGDSWYAKFDYRGDGSWQDEVVVQATASTVPLAICRAALKMMESKEGIVEDCQHEFFQCQVPAGDSCVAIYHKVCRKCRWDKNKGIFMPLDIWRGWALRQLQDCNSTEDKE